MRQASIVRSRLPRTGERRASRFAENMSPRHCRLPKPRERRLCHFRLSGIVCSGEFLRRLTTYSGLKASICSTTGIPGLSPFSPHLSLSPITVAKVEEGKLAKLEKLERLALYATISVPQELVYPSFGQVEENAEQITSFLDLYHLHSFDDANFSNKRSAAQREVLNGGALLSANGGDGTSWRVSRGIYSGKRRSRSVEGLYSLDDASEIASPRRSAGLRPLQSPSYPARPTTIMSAFTIPEYLISPSIYSEASADRDIHFDVPIIAPQHSPGKLERKRSIARARQSIVGADAKLMSRFRTEFGTRPLEFPLPPFPAPTGPLPSPPVSPSIQDVRSPRAPYWVKRSLRPRSPAQAQQHLTVVQESFINSKRTSRDSVNWATPRTRRSERRMGWGGRWNQSSMAGVIESLKEL
ncbi:uncharacterized protein LAESUDRAFT_150199 [Laetiporus sulphureus 93-53]|uniref:Uncharacterized protein n=1 Tax=Laetiporus sulphureus 93-53 TaxID=1314785 RepID=A0A165ECG8_9APHY|nr:uncharacterized protein LAESUDRAFT_150199 [Laetiporus sulphureus 93-53]KZT06727.1 hypothetical protein LAESUDRAFT_150199 [Laetiporus sulphureus 93-53]